MSCRKCFREMKEIGRGHFWPIGRHCQCKNIDAWTSHAFAADQLTVSVIKLTAPWFNWLFSLWPSLPSKVMSMWSKVTAKDLPPVVTFNWYSAILTQLSQSPKYLKIPRLNALKSYGLGFELAADGDDRFLNPPLPNPLQMSNNMLEAKID